MPTTLLLPKAKSTTSELASKLTPLTPKDQAIIKLKDHISELTSALSSASELFTNYDDLLARSLTLNNDLRKYNELLLIIGGALVVVGYLILKE